MGKKSIISNEKECFICGTRLKLHKHHCIHGSSNRKNSEEFGLWIYLCDFHHNASIEAVHFNHSFDVMVKKYAQMVFENKIGTREEFRQIFGKSFL